MLRKKPTKIITELKEGDHGEDGRMVHILICDDGIYSGTQMSQLVIDETIIASKYVLHKYVDPNFMMKINLHLVCPFMTTKGINKINERKFNVEKMSFKVDIYYDFLMQTLKELLDGEEYELSKIFRLGADAVPIYFDHKMPDYVSSLPRVYRQRQIKCDEDADRQFMDNMVHNCPNMGDRLGTVASYKCPIPPYKFRGHLDKVEMLNTKQYLEWIINNSLDIFIESNIIKI